MDTNKKRGKPNRTLMTKLRGLAWCKALEIRSNGMKNPLLEKKLFFEVIENSEDKKTRPKLVDKYFKGIYTPKNNNVREGGFNVIERTEAIFPGTASWYLNPMWDLMEINDLDLRKTYSIIIKIKIPNFSKFFVQPNLNIAAFQRNSWTDLKDIKEIANEPSLSAFIFLLGLMRESIIRLNAMEHFQACGGLRRLVPVLWNTPELRSLVGDIFDHLERSYFSVTYTTSGFTEMHSSKTWRDLHPEISKLYPSTLIDQKNMRQPFLELIEA